MNYNRMILGARLTRDPDLRYSQGGTAFCNIGLAETEKYKDQEDTLFIDAVAFGKTAELIDEHFRKGDPIMIEGKLSLDQWEDNEGTRRSKIKLKIDQFKFVGNKGDREQRPAANRSSHDDGPPVDDDDIPF